MQKAEQVSSNLHVCRKKILVTSVPTSEIVMILTLSIAFTVGASGIELTPKS